MGFTADNEQVMRQQMLMLSFISYVGRKLKGDSIDVELKEQIEQAMEQSVTVKNQWDIVWGPAIYKYQVPAGAPEPPKPTGPLPPRELKDIPSEDVATHMMFAVRSRQNPLLNAVIIRGTNGESWINEWEDLWGFETLTEWLYSPTSVNPRPQYAYGYDFALDKLQKMAPGDAVPGAGRTLKQFVDSLIDNTAPGAPPQIIITGQSLGGGLAPTVALWLKNEDGTAPDQAPPVEIFTYAYAGASVGNADFAKWSDQSIGANTYRVWQDLDMPPYKYNEESMKQNLATLYTDAGIDPDQAETQLIDLYEWLGKDKDYEQICAQEQPLQGTINRDPQYNTWLNQFHYQHVYGYLNVLELQDETGLVEQIFSHK